MSTLTLLGTTDRAAAKEAERQFLKCLMVRVLDRATLGYMSPGLANNLVPLQRDSIETSVHIYSEERLSVVPSSRCGDTSGSSISPCPRQCSSDAKVPNFSEAKQKPTCTSYGLDINFMLCVSYHI